MSAKEALDEINRIIAKRTSYGTRYEEVKADSLVLSWSNAGKTWGITWSPRYALQQGNVKGHYIKKNSIAHLDANMILVPYKYKLVEKLIPFLDPLPLYFLSFEAKMRKEVPAAEATLAWAIKQLERALKEKELERFR